jgi:protein SCO1/2
MDWCVNAVSHPMRRLALLLVFFAVLTGCKHSTEQLGKHTQSYVLKGTILATDEERGEVTLQHDAVPGFMEAMTMPYKLANREGVTELHVGDVIRARLLVYKSEDGDFRNPRIDEIAVIAQAKPNYKPTSNYHVPTQGDVVPDFQLVDQDGKPMHMSQFQGKALLITFIYTRCPMDDFCPKMSRNFAAIDKSLRSDKALSDRTDLLSISFDPVYDTPSVLKAYGAAYTGSSGFGHWQFAVPRKNSASNDAADDSLSKMEHYFNLGATPGENNTLNHSLSTVLIDPSGKIAAWYPGSEWRPEDVVAAMRSLART